MSIILSILMYLLLFMLVVFLAAIIIPTRYSLYGGYKNNLYCFASMHIFYFCKISISYDAQDSFAKVKALGFTIKIDIADLFKEKVAKPKINEEKKSTNNGASTEIFTSLFQKDIILHALSFLKDLVHILKPKVLMIKGKIGFYEPHHTAWLQAMVSTISELNILKNLHIDPVWDDEHFEGELTVKGQLAPIVIIFRLFKFLISKNTLKVIKIIIRARKKKRMLKPAT